MNAYYIKVEESDRILISRLFLNRNHSEHLHSKHYQSIHNHVTFILCFATI